MARILFTGGSGKAGRHVVPYLQEQGHHVLNVDLVPLDGVDNVYADITDSGQVFAALSTYSNLDELDAGAGPQPFDAVVHFAAIPRIGLRSDAQTYQINTSSTYNVIEAAVKLGVRKIIIASSETTYGICFADGLRNPARLPVTEDMDVVPEDSYAMSKLANEGAARGFQARSGADIYALRIGNVVEPHEYGNFQAYFDDPAVRRRNIFNYIDARDLGQIVHRCVVTDGLGFQIFNAANTTNSAQLTSRELAAQYFPNVPVDPNLGTYEALYSTQKIRDMLGFVEEHDWRRYV